jgi:hypothetical protein
MRSAIRNLKGKAPLVVLGCVVLLLLWMAGSIAVRSGLLGFGYLDPKQFGVFLAFIGACLGTVATVSATLLTRAHNAREYHRLRLDSVIKSIDSIPSGASKARLAGVLSTMTLLGHHRVAIRVLKPAWDEGDVDDGTATWVIGQVLVGAKPEAAKGDEDLDPHAANEAATLLFIRSRRLTDEEPGHCYFPGHFLKRWTTEQELAEEVKELLLLAIGQMLVARDKSWWAPNGDLPDWPVDVLLDCVRNERLPAIGASAAVLLTALQCRFPNDFRPDELADTSARANESPVSAEFAAFDDHIRNRWDPEPERPAEVA